MPSTCPDDGYPMRRALYFGNNPQPVCTNPWHPALPVCPGCGSEAEPVALKAHFGQPLLASCTDCDRTWDPKEPPGA
jgi:hypothetical protein